MPNAERIAERTKNKRKASTLTAQAAGELPPPTAPPPVPEEQIKLTALMPADGVTTGGDSTSLRWPKELPITANTDYVSFQFYNYNPPFGKGELDDIGDVQGSPLATAGAATPPAPAADAATGDRNKTPLGSASALYKGYTKTSVYGPKNKAKGYQKIT